MGFFLQKYEKTKQIFCYKSASDAIPEFICSVILRNIWSSLGIKQFAMEADQVSHNLISPTSCLLS